TPAGRAGRLLRLRPDRLARRVARDASIRNAGAPGCATCERWRTPASCLVWLGWIGLRGSVWPAGRPRDRWLPIRWLPSWSVGDHVVAPLLGARLDGQRRDHQGHDARDPAAPRHAHGVVVAAHPR